MEQRVQHGARRCSKFKVQGSRFKVQSSRFGKEGVLTLNVEHRTLNEKAEGRP